MNFTIQYRNILKDWNKPYLAINKAIINIHINKQYNSDSYGCENFYCYQMRNFKFNKAKVKHFVEIMIRIE